MVPTFLFYSFIAFQKASWWVEVDIRDLFDDLNQFIQRHVSHRQLIQTEESGAASEKAQQFLGWMWMEMPPGREAPLSFVLGPFCRPSGLHPPRDLQSTGN